MLRRKQFFFIGRGKFNSNSQQSIKYADRNSSRGVLV